MMDIQVDITDTALKTQRLLLRPWSETDVDDFYEYVSVEGVGELAGWRHHDSLETSKGILKSFISEKNVFAVVYRENNKVIGSVLSKQYWGQGLMPEAVKAVLSFCFEEQKADALTASHFLSNRQSQRVLEKCGFQPAGQAEYYAKQLQKHFVNMRYILFR